MSGTTAYKLGKWVADNKLLAAGIAVAVLYVLWPSPSEPGGSVTAAVVAPSSPSIPPCTNDLDSRLNSAKAKLKDKEYAAAVTLLEPCRSLVAADSDAAKTLNLAAAADQKAKAQAEAAERKRELAQWRKEGVSIGMTAERVLLSSWGKPDDINRTTTSRGIREQWVYDGGYLYFQDGVLTSIQN
jgi:hypothetical protein